MVKCISKAWNRKYVVWWQGCTSQDDTKERPELILQTFIYRCWRKVGSREQTGGLSVKTMKNESHFIYHKLIPTWRFLWALSITTSRHFSLQCIKTLGYFSLYSPDKFENAVIMARKCTCVNKHLHWMKNILQNRRFHCAAYRSICSQLKLQCNLGIWLQNDVKVWKLSLLNERRICDTCDLTSNA